MLLNKKSLFSITDKWEIAAAFFFLLAAFYPYPVESAEIDKLKAMGFQELRDKEARDFTLKDLDGNNVALKELRGKVVFLHFWATWCKPCKEEFPAIEKIHKEYKDKGLVILAVSTDKKEWKESVKSFARGMGAEFSVLLADEGNIDDAYWTWGIPTSYLVDRKGNILGRALGPRRWDSKESMMLFDALLKD